MAIPFDTLLEEAKCYLCLGISQAEALELALLNRIASSASGSYSIPILGGWPAGVTLDSTTYYFGGNTPWDFRTTNYDYASIIIPAAGEIISWYIKQFNNTPGTGELVPHFLRLNNATDFGEISFAYNALQTDGMATGLSQMVNAGDTIAMRVNNPAWVTNPAGVRYYGLITVRT